MKTRKFKKRKLTRNTFKKRRGGVNNSQNKNTLEVRYPSGKVYNGQMFTKLQTETEPHIHFTPKPDTLYTLLMWDPDAPAKPSWVHWIVTNLESANSITQNSVLQYQGPNPPSGIHRYFFGLFEQQSGKIQPMITGIRGRFDYKEFILQNNLKKVAEVYFKVSA